MSLFQDLVISYRLLAEYGLIDAYGHISVRSPDNPARFWLAAAVPPELVTEADLMECDMNSEPVDARQRSPVNERFIHGEVYKARPEVMGRPRRGRGTPPRCTRNTRPRAPLHPAPSSISCRSEKKIGSLPRHCEVSVRAAVSPCGRWP